MDLIQIERARVYRGETLVFADLSLAIPLGRQTVILGPNGAGKSTLLKLLSQEIHPVPREGSRLRIFGEERWNVWDLRQRLGIVSHELQLAYADWVTGFEVLLSGYHASIGVHQHQAYSPAHHARAEQVLAQIGMSSLRDRPYAAMSAGEQRRFLLGRALVHDPAALVLDEPTSGLDLRACLEYLRLVRDLMRQGKTILLVTHHIHEIPPEMAHVVLLKAGQVVKEGPKKELLSGPTLSALFEVPIQVVEAKGWYQILPQS